MRDDRNTMRTTLDLEVEVLQAAKEIAASRGVSAGQVVSELLRKALAPARSSKTRNGVPLLGRKTGAPPLTMAMVNRQREE
jgi:hypothetical protein